MSRSQLHAELNAVRALVEEGLAELTGAVDDLEQFWIAAARTRLIQIDGLLVEAAGGLAAPVRVAGGAAAWFAVFTSVAAVAGLAGLSSGWVIAVTVAAAIPLGVITPRVSRRISSVLNHRRLARATRLVHPPRHAPAVRPGPEGLLAVPETLLRARTRLVSIALRHVPPRHWTVASLRHAVRGDPAVSALARADLLLCQAVDCLERYLENLEKR